MTRPLIVLAAAYLPMVLEAGYSRANEGTLRTRGAVEPPHDVYRVMQVAYPACFAAIAAEGWLRDAPLDRWFAAGAAVFAGAKALKYWAIAALGERWTFRVLVLPGAPLVVSGPYRWLRHPNYVAVAGEMAGAALMAQAPIAGVAAVVAFGALMLRRIGVEERALHGCER